MPSVEGRVAAAAGRRRSIAPWVVAGLLVVLSGAAMRVEGRLWWCECGEIRVWITDVWTSHCSQHLLDPYSFSHFLHGVVFFWGLALAGRWIGMGWRFCIAIGLAAGWEVLENSPLIIDRYRTATMSLEYLGDSVVNATGDILACALGFVVARRVGVWWSLAVFVAIELVMLALMRDNLTLNVLMLVWPIEAIKQWQSAGHLPG